MMYACLYTKQKTQKRKVWQDGRLVVRGSVAHLHKADPVLGGGDPRLDACEVLTGSNLAPGQMLEMESHLVTVEGTWTGPVAATAAAASPAAAVAPPAPKATLPKFRKPPARPPPPPQQSSTVPPNLINRKRPLQPGELQQQFYGIQDVCLSNHGHQPQHVHGPSPEPPVQWRRAMHPSHPPVTAPSSSEPFAASLEYPPQRNQPLPQRSNQHHSREEPMLIPSQPPSASSCDPRGARSVGPWHPSRPAAAQGTEARARAPADKENASRHNLASRAFAGNNGFDPSRFYGDDEEEEEEEEEDEHDRAGREYELWGGALGVSGNGSASNVEPKQLRAPPPVVRGGEADSFSGTLSEDQLLELFGVPPSSSASSVISPPPYPSLCGEAQVGQATSGPSLVPTPIPGASRVLDASDFTLPDDDDDDSSASSS